MNTIKHWLGVSNMKLTLPDWALLPMPLLIFFSYYPLISFGSDPYKTHYELRLIELYLVVFVMVNLASVWRERAKLLASNAVRLVTVFGLYNTVSILWAPNWARALLTVGILWLLIFTFFSFLANNNLKKLVAPLSRVLIGSAVFTCLFAIYQMIAGDISWLHNWSLLCRGCQADQFGFARPNAFSIEPQFFGSLLTAPILLLFHASIVKKQSHSTYVVLGLLVFTLVLTLSRGAMVGVAAGTALLFFLDRQYYRRFIPVVAVSLLGIVFALFTQGLAAQLNPSVSDTFGQAIAKSINQLSLGKINLNSPAPAAQPPSTNTPTSTNGKSSKSSIFSGYIERSTDERVEGSCLALGIWQKTPQRMVFGTGIAGTGYYFGTNPIRSSLPWCKTNI